MDMEEMRRVRWKSVSLVPQSALNALDPLMRVGDQITEAIMVNEDVPRTDAAERAMRIFEDVRLEISRFGSYPHELSGGMKQRVMIAMAMACRPGLIIADEPTTALDVIVQAQILKLLDDLQHGMKSSIMLITHDLSIIVELCGKMAIMYGGKIVEYGDTRKIMENPLCPYTEALLDSFPHIEEAGTTFHSIPGSPPDMMNPPKGCIFHPRCRYAESICHKEAPQMVTVAENHYAVCHSVLKRATR
jgi:peptide/nickel transport system ATP-binding protein